VRLLVLLGCVLTYEPGVQFVHAVHEAASVVLLNVPLAQGAQETFVVLLPREAR
jgi:hypothetical protein